MAKSFHTNGSCDPQLHYMVDLSSRLRDIRKMVDEGKYFTINRARQYGKTTMLAALADYLKDDYSVISMDFQTISHADFETEQSFAAAFAREVLDCAEDIPDDVRAKLELYSSGMVREATLSVLFKALGQLCREAAKKIVLIIDEVDTASNNQVFLGFLAQLRAYYLRRRKTPTFQSVILAGVYDVRNIQRKMNPHENHGQNSPWNIAADFDVEMRFSRADIAGMLEQYDADCHLEMDVEQMAGLLFDYTSGYPFLVSRLCELMDQRIAGTEGFGDKASVWTKPGVLEAVRRLLIEKNTLFESLIGKLNEYPELRKMVYLLLFQGETISYNADDSETDILLMFGFATVENGAVQIANRIFETRLYNYFMTLPEVQSGDMHRLALRNKNQFIQAGRLNMELLLEKFVVHFDDVYGDRGENFVEEDGRRYFMLYLKPIINGIGNYYVEARTRNLERTDLIIDYCGFQYVIEMKVWHGNAYNERGEEQLLGYLDHYHLTRGYMLSFNFNKKKKIGVKEIRLGEKTLIEAVV
nr:AAA-like domain-containing protein [uncultured Acetatifactor sp.]